MEYSQGSSPRTQPRARPKKGDFFLEMRRTGATWASWVNPFLTVSVFLSYLIHPTAAGCAPSSHPANSLLLNLYTVSRFRLQLTIKTKFPTSEKATWNKGKIWDPISWWNRGLLHSKFKGRGQQVDSWSNMVSCVSKQKAPQSPTYLEVWGVGSQWLLWMVRLNPKHLISREATQ